MGASNTLLEELHSDLSRRYRMHAAAIESIWRSFDSNQRKRCLIAGAADGNVLRHRSDASMGTAYSIIPEWNLHDITEHDPDFLLAVLKHRASVSLFGQYCSGVKDEPGDRDFILDSMQTNGLRLNDTYENAYTLFAEEQYGQSFEVMSHHTDILQALELPIRGGLCVPQSTGELIMLRQQVLLQSLIFMVEDTLDLGSPTRDRTKRASAPSAALTRTSAHTPKVKPTIQQLCANALAQLEERRAHLELLSTEPAVLTDAVKSQYFSQPELMPDERGYRLPVHTDRFMSAAFFDTVQSAVRRAATWDYLSRLLNTLEQSGNDRAYRIIISQELINVSHHEYERVQANFKRHVQCNVGSENFHRRFEAGAKARVLMEKNPEAFTRKDPQLHYVSRLCQSETTPSQAIIWLEKLGLLHESHSSERERMQEGELLALYDLAIVAGFVNDLFSLLKTPMRSDQKGQAFISGLQRLEEELNHIKSKIDLCELITPIDHLLEPGIASSTLSALDQFIVQAAGTTLGFLYEELIDKSFADIQNRCQQVLEVHSHDQAAHYDLSTPGELVSRCKERKQKEKTRSSNSSVYDIVQQPAEPIADASRDPLQTFEVKATTKDVFSSLFVTGTARGSVNWNAFKAAMGDLGFMIEPKSGSVFTFSPPEIMRIKKPFTFHRPHKPQIEGHMVFTVARRLERLYGWNEETFKLRNDGE